MGIRVEYGPSAVSVGELGFRTGQNEYLNKRRAELEEQAMRQMEMRNRSQMQQMGIVADMQQQQHREAGAMARLQMQHQMGQQDQDAQFAHQLKMAEDARQHAMDLQDVFGQRAVDQAILNHNLGNADDLQRIQNKQIEDMFANDLNQAGIDKGMGIMDQIQKLQKDPRVKPEDAQQQIQQLQDELMGLAKDPMNTIAKEERIGFTQKWGPDVDGNRALTRTRVGENEYVYAKNFTKKVKSVDENGQEIWNEIRINEQEFDDMYVPKPTWDKGILTTWDWDMETGELTKSTQIAKNPNQDEIDRRDKATDAWLDYQASFDGVNKIMPAEMTRNKFMQENYPEFAEPENVLPENTDPDMPVANWDEVPEEQFLPQEPAVQPPQRGMRDNPFENAMEAAAVAKPGSRVHIRTPNGGTAEIIVHGR